MTRVNGRRFQDKQSKDIQQVHDGTADNKCPFESVDDKSGEADGNGAPDRLSVNCSFNLLG